MRWTFTSNMYRTIESLSIITNTPALLAVNYRPFCLRITERSTCPSEPRLTPDLALAKDLSLRVSPPSAGLSPDSSAVVDTTVRSGSSRTSTSPHPSPLWELATPWRHLWPGSWLHVPDCRHSPCRARGACPPDDRSQVLGTRSWRDVTYLCRAPAVLLYSCLQVGRRLFSSLPSFSCVYVFIFYDWSV